MQARGTRITASVGFWMTASGTFSIRTSWVLCMTVARIGLSPKARSSLGGLAGGKISASRRVSPRGGRGPAVPVVDDEVIGAPESERPGREVELSLDRGQGRRQVAGLLLTEVVAHLDRERQHPDQRPGRVVVHQLGCDLAPVGGDQNALLRHGGSDQS